MRVAILTYSNLALFELGCACDLFALPRPEFEHWYHTRIVSFEADPMPATGGILITAEQVSDLHDIDMLVVPSWPVQAGFISQQLKQAVLDLAARGGRIISFCSGAFLLAELGLLNGREAITHWRYAEQFKQRFPQVNYRDNTLYFFDGTIGCAAGSAAGLDLGLEVIRYDYGQAIANRVAKRLVVAAQREGGQAQFVEPPVIKDNNHFNNALHWVLSRLEKPVNVDDIAQKANMSRRHFDRQFRAHFQMAPVEWLNRQRIYRAREQLEQTSLSIEQIATCCGYESVVTLRHNFHKILGISPSRYRQQFRA